MKILRRFEIIVFGFLLAISSLGPSNAFSDEPYLSSLLERPALFDGPDTARQRLRESGVDTKASWTQFFQGLHGNGDSGWQTGGKGDLVITLNGEKLGLWSGFFVNLHQEIVVGKDVNDINNGTFIPVNTALAFPRFGGYDYDTSILFTQGFGQSVQLSFGKFNMLDAAARTPLIGGGGIDTFMNLGLAAPISGVTPPYLLGASLGLNLKPVSLNFFIYDPRNAQDWDVVSHPFAEGVTLSVSSTLQTQIADLPGFYSLRGVVSTDESIDLRDVPQILLPPGYPTTIGTKSNPWFVSFSGQQYLWTDPSDPSKGWGVFGQVGLSDGNPTPILSSVFAGLGGDSMLPGRSEDRWGIAYFRYDLSDDLRSGLAAPPFNIVLGPEEGIEAYYNLAVTPWLRVTADLQWIDDFTTFGSDSWVFGLRTQIKL